LPPDAVLYRGEPGDDIGCIACDGANRYLSITATGVAVGDAAGVTAAVTWDAPGTVTSFGATLHTSTNEGRYGVAVYRNVAATTPPTGDSNYRAGCAIEVGQTSCRVDTPGTPLAAGDKVTIIVGEAGTGTGDFPSTGGSCSNPTRRSSDPSVLDLAT
jgi:hypothetical protein